MVLTRQNKKRGIDAGSNFNKNEITHQIHKDEKSLSC